MKLCFFFPRSWLMISVPLLLRNLRISTESFANFTCAYFRMAFFTISELHDLIWWTSGYILVPSVIKLSLSTLHRLWLKRREMVHTTLSEALSLKKLLLSKRKLEKSCTLKTMLLFFQCPCLGLTLKMLLLQNLEAVYFKFSLPEKVTNVKRQLMLDLDNV